MFNIWSRPKFEWQNLISGSALALSFVAFHTGSIASAQALEAPSGNLDIPHVRHIVGLEGVKANISGDLTFDESTMRFKAGDLRNDVPLRSIRAFSISHDNRALIGDRGRIGSFWCGSGHYCHPTGR